MIQNITISKTYPFDNTKADIVAVANKLGYQKEIVDTTKLDASGNVPLEPMVDATGAPVYEMIDEVQPDGTVKQVQGKQLVSPVNVYIPNDKTELVHVTEVISKKIDALIGQTIADAIFAVQQDTMQAQKRATEEAIKAGITTV